MELNAIEKYVISKLENLEKENAELKKKLKEEENQSNNASIGFRYRLDTSSYYITKENVSRYEKALEEKNFEWLDCNGYHINMLEWNYEITLQGQKFYLNFCKSYSTKKLSACLVDIDRDDVFETEQEAKNALLRGLAEDITEKKEKL